MFRMWDLTLLKDSILWLVFVATQLMYRVARQSKIGYYFKTELKSLLKLTLLLEFIAGLYSFNFWLEFLIVPFAVLLGALIAFTQNEEKYQKVNKQLKQISLYMGILIFLSVLEHVITNIKTYWKLVYLKQFLLPLELSFFFVPFLYFLALYIKYEDALALLRFRIKPKKLYKFAKIQAMLRFRHDYEGLRQWQMSLARQRPTNRKEVLETIKEVKLMQQDMENPPEIKLEQGWSPFKAKDFLKDNHIITGYYVHYYDDEWGAISPPLKLDENFICNDITYSISGDRNIVRELKLTLSVFDKKTENNSHELLLLLAIVLYKKAFDKVLPNGFAESITNCKNFSINNDLETIKVKKELFGNITKSYHLYFTIMHH